MKGKAPSARGKAGWRRVELDLAKAGNVFREAGYCISPDDPLEAYGHADRQGRWRRMHARFPGGWRATLVIRTDGSYSLSYALRLVMGPKAATA